jgi:ankyrin repeat protein
MWAAFYRTDSSYSNSSTQLLDQDAMVRLLLRSGANPRLRDKAGQTARDLAIRANNLHVVRALDKFKLPTKLGR